MTEWKYLWWPLPKGGDDVKAYVEKKFQFAGEHVWMKLLRGAVEKRLNPKQAVKSATNAPAPTGKKGA